MDFVFDEEANDKIISYVQLRESDSNEPFFDKLTFIYIEMPKFLKEVHELHTILDKWLYVFKNMHELEKIPTSVKEAIFLKLFEEAKISNYSPKDFMRYKESWKIYNDNKNSLDFATNKAEKKGLAEGLQQGLQQANEKAEAKSIETATFLVQKTTLTDAEIAEATTLSIEKIKQIRANIK